MSDFSAFLKSRRKTNLAIVIVNLAVYLILEILGNTENSQFMVEHGAAYTPYILQGQYWRLFSSMFLHFGFYHIVYNMLSLIFIGDILENIVGPVRYLVIYLGGGLCGNLLSLALSVRSGRYTVSAGASGAIFAVIGALLYIALRNRNFFGEKNLHRFAMMILLMILQGVIDKGVDNAAHAGGLVGGFILAIVLYHPRRRKDVKEAQQPDC